MGDLIDLKTEKTTAESLAEAEATNQRLAAEMGRMGYGLDSAAVIAARLDALLEGLLSPDQMVHFELKFQLKMQQVLEDMVRQITLQKLTGGNGGLVIPQ